MPKTKLGKWTVKLIIIFLLLFGTAQVAVALGQGGPDFNPFIGVPMIAAALSAVCGFFTGIVSIVRRGERGLLVFVSTFIGFAILFFVVGEFAFPH